MGQRIPNHGNPGARDTESRDRETPRTRDALAVINEYSVVVFNESPVGTAFDMRRFERVLERVRNGSPFGQPSGSPSAERQNCKTNS